MTSPVALTETLIDTARRAHTVLDSPLGALTLVAEGGRLRGLYLEAQRHRPPQDTFGDRDPGPFADAVTQLEEYFAGTRSDFDLPITLAGTEFQRRVWAQLRQIPYGRTVSYSELADQLGQPSASRAVGLATGKNPLSIIVACHRVVSSTGALTGYAGGLARKRFLLDFERGSCSGLDSAKSV